MKVATWNVNSVRARQERFLIHTARNGPSLLEFFEEISPGDLGALPQAVVFASRMRCFQERELGRELGPYVTLQVAYLRSRRRKFRRSSGRRMRNIRSRTKGRRRQRGRPRPLHGRRLQSAGLVFRLGLGNLHRLDRIFCFLAFVFLDFRVFRNFRK